MWYAADGMGWWLLWGGLMMVIFWGAIFALIVWAFQASTQQGGEQGASVNAGSKQLKPLDIARKRYAEGEITRVEFDQLREDLKDYSRSEVLQVSGKRTPEH